MGLDEEPARRMSRVTPWTTAAAVSTCRRRAASSTAAVCSSSAAALSCSCCASMYQTSARSRGWRSELALHRRPALCVPTSRDPERTRLHRQLSAFGLFSLLFATIEGPVHWWTGARIRRVRRGGTVATAFAAWELRWSHPCSTRASTGYRPSGTGRPLSRSSSLWRHVTMVQRRSRSWRLVPRPCWQRLAPRAG